LGVSVMLIAGKPIHVPQAAMEQAPSIELDDRSGAGAFALGTAHARINGAHDAGNDAVLVRECHRRIDVAPAAGIQTGELMGPRGGSGCCNLRQTAEVLLRPLARSDHVHSFAFGVPESDPRPAYLRSLA